ncbi:MAG: hypothetical protein R3F49_03365 [Planctomycetota bacterium]
MEDAAEGAADRATERPAEPPTERPDEPPTERAAERRAEVEERIRVLRADIARMERGRQPGPHARFRVIVWSVALVGLFSALRPGAALAGGPRVRLVAGAGTAGGHRLEAQGATAPVGPGDVLVASPEGRLELRVGGGALVVHGGGRALVERLGPPSLRVLRAPAYARGPLAVTTPDGHLSVPEGVTVRIAGADPAGSSPTPGGSGAAAGALMHSPWTFEADAPGAELCDATGTHPVVVAAF